VNINIRFARINDIPLILQFVKDLAEYEQALHNVIATEEDLCNTLFGERQYAEVVLAYVDNVPVGFAAFSYSFSTFLGKPGLYLENLYVIPEMRGMGIAKRIFSFLANIVLERNYGRLELAVLEWNRFLSKNGSKAYRWINYTKICGVSYS
jgi:GNAT superfamily N-acetyltransferase